MLAMTRVFVVVLDASFDLHNLASKECLFWQKRRMTDLSIYYNSWCLMLCEQCKNISIAFDSILQFIIIVVTLFVRHKY